MYAAVATTEAEKTVAVVLFVITVCLNFLVLLPLAAHKLRSKWPYLDSNESLLTEYILFLFFQIF